MKQIVISDNEFISLRIKGLLFGLSVKHVQDVIYTPKMTAVPLAPLILRGLLNLRGRIVSAIDLGLILEIGPTYDPLKEHCEQNTMSIIIEIGNELYSFIVDSVGDVISIPTHMIEKKPSNLDERWRQFTSGVFPYENDLLVILEEQKIFADLFSGLI